MADDIIDIIHKIAFQVEDAKLENLTSGIKRQVSEITKLTQRQVEYSKLLKKMTLDETTGRAKVIDQMGKTKEAIDKEKKSLEDLVLTNKKFNDVLVKEKGLIGAVEEKLKILQNRRKSATSESELKKYSQLITTERSKLSNLENLGAKKSGGLGGLMGGSGMGAVSRLIPAIGGALGLASLGSQMVDVTKKFEGYIQTLKNAYGSSIKAEGAFNKIQQFASKTPYSVDELTSSFIKLKNRGFDPTTAELTKLGDLASSQGKSFDQLTEAVLDAQTGENERLKEFGIKAKAVGDQVTFTFKGVSKTVSKFSEVDIRNAILGFGELQGVVGGMAGQAQTLDGKLSNLGDSVDMLMFNLSKRLGVNSFLGSLVDMANDALSALKDLLDTSQETAVQSKNESEQGMALVSEYEKLEKQTKLTADQKDRMLVIQNDLVNIFGQSILMIDKETGALVVNKKAVIDLINQKMLLANTQASNLARSIKSKKDKVEELKSGISQNDKTIRAIANNANLSETDIAQMYGDPYFDPDNIDKYTAFQKKQFKKILALKNNSEEKKKTIGVRGKARTSFFSSGIGYTSGESGLLGEVGDDVVQLENLSFSEKDVESLYNKNYEDSKTPIKPIRATPKKKTEKKKTAKGESPQEKELKRLAELEKIARDEEDKKNAKYLIKQNAFLNDKAISQAVYDARMQQNAQLHESAMLNITIKYAKLKAPLQKGSDKSGSEKDVTESESQLTEINRLAKERAEAEIKTAIDTFNTFNSELFELQDQSDAMEIQRMKDQHQKKLSLIDEQIKEEQDKYAVAVETGNQNAQVVILSSMKTLNEKKIAQEKTNGKEIQKTLNKQYSERVDAEMQLQIDALNKWSDQELLNFGFKIDGNQQRNEEEIEQLKASGKDKEKLQKLIQLDELYIAYKGQNDKLGQMIASGVSTKEELDKQQKEVDDLAKEIKAKSESSAQEKKDWEQSWKEAKLKDYIELAQAALSSASTIVSAFESQVDKEIEIKSKRVEKAKEIADRGNVDVLELEEKRLASAQKQKEKYARQQIAINAIQQISNMTLAITQAAAAGGGILSLPAIIAMIGALGTGFAMAKQMSSDSTPAFKDGIINFQGKGTGISDSNIVRISHGESVINAESTKRNADVLRMINSGAKIKPLSYVSNEIKPDYQSQKSEILDLRKDLQDVKNAILSKPNQSVEIDRRGISVITEEIRLTNRKRWNV